MANLQRMLGVLLSSRMAGRGGMGGALGSAGMLGALGGGRRGGGLGSGLGGKAGLAALGYLAYRTYQNSQQDRQRDARRPEETHQSGTGPLGGLLDSLTGSGQSGRTAGSGASSGASLGERIGNLLNPASDEPADDDAISEKDAVGDNKALLLIRAMIAAANSDGKISPDERARIVGKVDEAGGDADDHRTIEKELRNPRPLDELLREVRDPETAQQFYLASRAAVEGTNEVQKSYLSFLRQRLDLHEADVAEIEKFAS
jgi:uncharacterized membrane protein YebE (DUF533 family)